MGGGIHQSPRSTIFGQGPHEVSRAAIASEITVPQSQGPPIGLSQLGPAVGQYLVHTHHDHLVAVALAEVV